MKLLLVLLALIGATATAAPSYKLFFISNGKTIAAEDAIMAASRGNEVYKCQAVEAKVSKSGTSIGLKNIKKPKADK